MVVLEGGSFLRAMQHCYPATRHTAANAETLTAHSLRALLTSIDISALLYTLEHSARLYTHADRGRSPGRLAAMPGCATRV